VPGARWIAAASYSLYLSHKLAFHAVENLFEARLHGLLAFAVYAATTLLFGALLHYGVERPFLLIRDRKSARGIERPEAGQGKDVPVEAL
jgi:peptidoglycan/LPS O-acetylase OafA/YrhL